MSQERDLKPQITSVFIPPPPPPPAGRAPGPPPLNEPSLLLSTVENQTLFETLGKGRQTLATAVLRAFTVSFDHELRLQQLQVPHSSKPEISDLNGDAEVVTTFLETEKAESEKAVEKSEILLSAPVPKPRKSLNKFESQDATIPSEESQSDTESEPEPVFSTEDAKIDDEETVIANSLDALKKMEVELVAMKQKNEIYEKWLTEGTLDPTETSFHQKLTNGIVHKENEIAKLKLDIEKLKQSLKEKDERVKPSYSLENLEEPKSYSGVICFIRDSTKKSYFIDVFSLKANRRVFRQEITKEFQFQMPEPTLMTFQGDGPIISAIFVDSAETKNFSDALNDKMEAIMRRKMYQEMKKPSGDVSKARCPPPAPPLPSTPSAFKAENSNGPRKPLTAKDIGHPYDFRHVQHIGYNPNKGFNLSLEDKDMRAFFEKAGISSEHLSDENTRKFIYDFIERHDVVEVVKQSSKDDDDSAPISTQESNVI